MNSYFVILMAAVLPAAYSFGASLDDQEINLTISINAEDNDRLILHIPAYLSGPTTGDYKFNGNSVKKAVSQSSSNGSTGKSKYTAAALHFDNSIEVVHQSTECGNVHYKGRLISQGNSIKEISSNGKCRLVLRRSVNSKEDG